MKDRLPIEPPEFRGARSFAPPTFYLTGRAPLRPGTILLAMVAAAGLLGLILYAMGHAGDARRAAGGAGGPGSPGASSGAGGGAGDDGSADEDDPSQIDTIVLGDPADPDDPDSVREAPLPARPDHHVSTVHPFILIKLPRSGAGVGQIPASAAGRLLYDWLGGFNQANYGALAAALPTAAAVTGAQMELRRRTGGFTLLSAKEVAPGLLVFRLRDQTPESHEVLGSLQVRPGSIPVVMAAFNLRDVSAPPNRDVPAAR